MNRGGRDRGRFNNKRFYCQLCGKPGHFANKCYHRFDRGFQRGSSQFRNYGQSHQGTNSGFQTKPQAYLVGPSEVNEVFMSDLGSSPPYNSLPQSTDAQSQFSSPPWFVNSGATNHVATSLNNLSRSSPYHGNDKVTVGDGKSLPISHIGLSHLYTNTHPQSVLSLSNVLHVPKMKKSPFSVSQLTKDNNVIVEFDSTSCLIKDKASGLVLIRGTLGMVYISWSLHLILQCPRPKPLVFQRPQTLLPTFLPRSWMLLVHLLINLQSSI